MAYRELPPRKVSTRRSIRDGTGTVWQLRELPARPGTMGTAFCILLFEASPTERRWKPFIKGDLFLLPHERLVRELYDAAPVPARKVIPEHTELETPRALTEGDFEEGA